MNIKETQYVKKRFPPAGISLLLRAKAGGGESSCAGNRLNAAIVAAATRAATPYELKNKLIRYGLAQGYDYEAVRDAADALIATTDDSCDTFF